MTEREQFLGEIEKKLYNYKAMLKRAEPNSEDFYCCRARVALCEELLIAAKTIFKEPASEDLEKELKHYCNDYYNCDYPKQLEEENCSGVMPHIVSAAKHFAQWQKEQMMKDAVEGMVCGKVIDHINVRVEGYNALTPSNITHIPCERKNFHKFKIGDKVKVIIIKE